MKNDVSELNSLWEKRIKDAGADFVYFVDASALPSEAVNGYSCALLFGKALSKEYVRAVHDGLPPKTKEIFNTERKLDALSEKVALWLADEGFASAGKLKTGVLPHKTVALRAGIGFIGKNNLLVTKEYGCALMLGRVLTTAPFKTTAVEPMKPECGDCKACVNACAPGALKGTAWNINLVREDMITRKLCTLCHRCMVMCPYTESYMNREGE